jgi:hypothetical protein
MWKWSKAHACVLKTVIINPLGKFIYAKRKTNFGNVADSKKIRREKVGPVPPLYRDLKFGINFLYYTSEVINFAEIFH